MSPQFFPRLRGEACLSVDGFPHWLSTAGTVCALQPVGIQRLTNQIERICGNRRFLFFPGGMANADEKSGK